MLVLAATSAPMALKIGALLFGAVVGWNAYFINRYRQTIVIGDLAVLISAVGGGAILTLFPAQSETFGYYGIGLAIGFFAYLAMMLVLVAISPNATVDWILGFGGRPTAVVDQPPDRPAIAPTGVEHVMDAKLSGKLRVPLPPL
jgi:hypothetical protein